MDHEKLRGLVCYMYMMGPLIFLTWLIMTVASLAGTTRVFFFPALLKEVLQKERMSRLAIVPKDKTSDNRQPALQHFYQNQQQPQVSVYGSK